MVENRTEAWRRCLSGWRWISCALIEPLSSCCCSSCVLLEGRSSYTIERTYHILHCSRSTMSRHACPWCSFTEAEACYASVRLACAAAAVHTAKSNFSQPSYIRYAINVPIGWACEPTPTTGTYPRFLSQVGQLADIIVKIKINPFRGFSYKSCTFIPFWSWGRLGLVVSSYACCCMRTVMLLPWWGYGLRMVGLARRFVDGVLVAMPDFCTMVGGCCCCFREVF